MFFVYNDFLLSFVCNVGIQCTVGVLWCKLQAPSGNAYHYALLAHPALASSMLWIVCPCRVFLHYIHIHISQGSCVLVLIALMVCVPTGRKMCDIGCSWGRLHKIKQIMVRLYCNCRYRQARMRECVAVARD